MPQPTSTHNGQVSAQFGDLLRARRRALGLTQRQLSQAAACAEITLRKIEARERSPSPQLVQMFAQALKLDGVERERFISAALATNAQVTTLTSSAPANAQIRSPEIIDQSASAYFMRYADAQTRDAHALLAANVEAVRDLLRQRALRDSRGALRLSGLLVRFWVNTNLVSEGRGWSEHALSLDVTPSADRALALLCAGVLANIQGDTTHSKTRIEECLTIANSLPEAQGAHAVLRPHALHATGTLAMQNTQDREAALRNFNAAIDAYEAIDMPLHAAHVRCDVALTYAYCSPPDVERSISEAERALSVFQTAGNASGEAFALGMLAEARLSAGLHAEAEPFALRALDASRAAAFDLDVGWAMSRLSEIMRLQGKLADARRHSEDALTYFQKVGERRALCYRLQGLAQIARAAGDEAEARSRLAASLPLAHELHNRPAVLRAFTELIALALERRDAPQAATLLGAIDERRAFLNDDVSRTICDATEASVLHACAEIHIDPSAARGRGATLSLRELAALVL
jgi:transcriptional regulator with XRE-family HTH domain